MPGEALPTEMRERPYLHIGGLDGDGLVVPSGAAAPPTVQPGPATGYISQCRSRPFDHLISSRAGRGPNEFQFIKSVC